MEKAIFGGGCFWCLEAVFEQLQGVETVTSGYAGGWVENPTYESICSGDTGHAEVLQISFDPAVITYRQLLNIFFAIHDPTSLNRQGADVGTQYRSVIFVQSTDQLGVVREQINCLVDEHVYDGPIVTEVSEAAVFYPAESYHQGYFRNNPEQGYCTFVVSPKVSFARQAFLGLFRLVGQ